MNDHDDHRHQQTRLRRGVLILVAGLTSLAIALPVGLILASDSADRSRADSATTTPAQPTPSPQRTASPEPTVSPSRTASRPARPGPVPTPGPTVSTEARTIITTDFDRLPRGEEPTVPWLSGDRIHHGTTSTPIDPTGSPRFEPVADGYITVSYPPKGDSDPQLRLIGLDGREKLRGEVSSDPVVSKDLRRFAWAPEEDVAKVIDARTGDLLHESTDGEPAGFLGSRVLLRSTGSGPPEVAVRPLVWDPRSGELTPWDHILFAHSTDGRTLAGTSPQYAQGNPIDRGICAAVVDTEEENREQWRICPRQFGAVGISAFSPGGRYAIMGVSYDANDGPTDDATIADARTGRAFVTLKEYAPIIAWEDEEHFVFLAFDHPSKKKVAIVRCDLDGRCELATDPLPAPDGAEPLPYQVMGIH